MLCSIFVGVGLLFAPQAAFAVPLDTDPANPDTAITAPDDSTNPANPNAEQSTDALNVTDAACYDQVGGLGWLVCPATHALAKFIDVIYEVLSSWLIVSPISTDQDSPIYLVWEYIRNITNVVFIIFILVIIYSQVTGFGLSNYGIKSVLPRIILAAIMVNLSFIICALAVDISNVLGASIRDVFSNIQASAGGAPETYSFREVAGAIASGAVLTVGGAAIAYASGAIFLLIPIIFAGVIAVFTAFIVMAARQALIILLLIVSPLALVAYLLPNTEGWFNKWRDLFLQMLVFYPMFALLFGASQLASWVIFASANGNFLFVVLSIAVQLLPLFFALSLMQMSNTVLGSISTGIQKLTAPAQQGVGSWANTRAAEKREATRNAWLANNSRFTGARAANWLAYRRKRRDLKSENDATTVAERTKLRALTADAGHKAKWNEKTKFYDVIERTAAGEKPTKQAVAAKRARKTIAGSENAEKRLSNYLGQMGKYHPRSIEAKVLGRQSDIEAEEALIQDSLAENIERDDTEILLNKVFDARKAVGRTLSAEQLEDHKRIIQRSAGMLDKKYEETIMQKVLDQMATIERRDRGRNRIAINKFADSTPLYKFKYRAFALGHYIDDNGNFTDENGNPSETMVEYKHEDEVNGKKVRYLDLEDTDHKTIYRMYSSDSALIKETVADNLAIGDGANKNFIIAAADGNSLRSYNAAIANGLLDVGFKNNAPWFGPMFASYIRQGNINTKGKLAIAALDSIQKTGKPGALLTADSWCVKDFLSWFDALYSYDENSPDGNKKFFDVFSKSDIDEFINVNGLPFDQKLKGASTAEKIDFFQKQLGAEAYSKLFDAILGARNSKVLDSQKESVRQKYASLLQLHGKVKDKNSEVFDNIMSAYELSMKAKQIKDGTYGKGQSAVDNTAGKPTNRNSIYNLDRYKNANAGIREKIEDYLLDRSTDLSPNNRENIFSNLLGIFDEHESLATDRSAQDAIHEILMDDNLGPEEVVEDINRILDSFFSDTHRPYHGD